MRGRGNGCSNGGSEQKLASAHAQSAHPSLYNLHNVCSSTLCSSAQAHSAPAQCTVCSSYVSNVALLCTISAHHASNFALLILQLLCWTLIMHNLWSCMYVVNITVFCTASLLFPPLLLWALVMHQSWWPAHYTRVCSTHSTIAWSVIKHQSCSALIL